MASSSPGPGLTLINEKDITRGKILGGGGFGAVYVAKHANWGKVAVKEFKGISLTSDIRKEADKMLRAVSSQHLVSIKGLIEHSDNQIDIVMEYCEYGSLKEFEKRYMKCDCWARKVKMVQDIAFGMNYLHTLNPPIIHRDLKLDNVFVGSGFDAKIGDLGLAVSTTKSIRRAGVAGTISHIPPEALNPKAPKPDKFFDIYTFSVTSYELVFGKDPWPQLAEFNDGVIAAWVKQGYRPDVEDVPPEAPNDLIDLITKCWDAEPKQRPGFKSILESVTKLFEANYEAGLRRADRAISEQIDRVQEADEVTVSVTESSQSSDPWASLEDMNIKDKRVTLMPGKSDSVSASGKDSGLGTSEDGKGGLKGVEFNKKESVQPKSRGATAKNESVMPKSGKSDAGSVSGFGKDSGRVDGKGVKFWITRALKPKKRDAATKEESDMTWQYKQSVPQTIDLRDNINACHMISASRLAVCMRYNSNVKVYDVSEGRSHLYTVSIEEWKGEKVRGVAVSDSLPDSMLVICALQPYVYQCPRHEATEVIAKHKIKSDEEDPLCIVANANTAVIGMFSGKSLIVCKLPGFTQQSSVKLGFHPLDISITSDYLVLMGGREIVVRSLSNVKKDVCRIKPPVGCRSVCCRNNDREIYAACECTNGVSRNGNVYKYTWDGAGKPSYGKPTCIIEGLWYVGKLGNRCLSVSTDGLLAVRLMGDMVKIYKLQ